MKIKNRKGQNIDVVVDEAPNAKGIVFVMHGLGGFKEQNHIKMFAEAFVEKDVTAIRFDTTNTLGESDGAYENATVTNYYSDLEDVIEWSRLQKWYQEPFYLIGHSLGGLCTALYAEKHPSKVKGLSPISTVVSGKLSEEAHKEFEPESYDTWQKTGWLIKESNSKPGTMKKLKWSHMNDRLQYDLIPGAGLLTMPVLLITGEKDTATPPKHVEILYKALPGSVQSHFLIHDAPHTFTEPKHIEEVKMLIQNWITAIENTSL